MKKEEREKYVYQKKCLLIILYLFYLNEVDYKAITFRSFGFHFDPSCNFKAIVKSKKDHIHKYSIHIFDSLRGVNFDELDVMGNFNIIKIKNLKNFEPIIPTSSINVYFDESNFIAYGFIEGKKIEFKLINDNKIIFKDELLFNLNRDSEARNDLEYPFIVWMLKFYNYKLKTTLVMGAGINCDYGAKDWKSLITSLNETYYSSNNKLIEEITHYAGNELFVSSKILKTSGFDVYKELNDELYHFKEAKSFSDPDSTLYNCVNFIERKGDIEVISYNYDTNLEYLLKKRNIMYNTVYDDNSFINKESKVSIFHVHGLLPYEKYDESKFTDSLIFNESEYFYLYNNPYSWNISKQMHDFTFNLCIFIGISMTDPNMKRLLELSKNYLKFNFIFLKKEENYDAKTYRDVTNYLFTYDLVTIWVDEYKDIGKYLEEI